MSDDKELIELLREGAKRDRPHTFKTDFKWSAADLVERLAADLDAARKDADRWRSMYRAAVQVGAELETNNGNMRRALERFKLLVDDRGVEWVSFFGETVHCRVQLLNVAPDLRAGIKQAVQCAMRASAP